MFLKFPGNGFDFADVWVMIFPAMQNAVVYGNVFFSSLLKG